MNLLATLPGWFLRLLGADSTSASSEVWFAFEGMDPGWAVLLGGLFAAAIGFAYWKSPGRLSKPQRIGLAALRAFFLLLILFILTHPVIRLTEEVESRGTLLVLQDVSASMGLEDPRLAEADQERVAAAYGSSARTEENPRPSRRELVRAMAANEELNLWPRIAEKADILVAPFGRQAGPAHPLVTSKSNTLSAGEAAAYFGSLDFDASSTAVADSLSDALDALAGQPLAGVLLISDGMSNVGSPMTTALDPLRDRNLPLFAYAVGVEAQRDLSVVSFSSPGMAFAGETAMLDVRLRATDLAGESTEVRLIQDGETIDAQEAAFEEDGEVELSFPYVTERAGFFPFTLEAGAIEGEVTLENNEASLELQVLDRRVRVLVIEQEPRWDFRYLLDTLKRDERVEVSAVMLDGDKTLGRDPESGFLAELPTPEELLGYVIVVLGDVDPDRLSDAHFDALDRLARQTGGGLVFHAGSDFNPFAYAGTPLEALLPVELDPTVENRGARYEDPVSLSLTREGRRSPLLRLDENPLKSEQIWRSFPPVRWTAQTGPAKPAAEVLLVDPTEAKQARGDPQPVLAHMSVGRGQIFYFGIDETYRWRSRMGEKHYLKIWGQVFLKLGIERLSGASDLVQLNTVRDAYAVGETILVSGRIFDKGFRPLEAPEVAGTLKIEPAVEGGATVIEQEVTLKSRPGSPGDYELEVFGATPGRYTLQTELDPEASVGFTVDISNLELRDAALNLEGLTQLAGEQGRVFREEDISELPDAVSESLPTIRDVSRYEPAFHPIVYALLLLLPVAEWTSRRLLKLK